MRKFQLFDEFAGPVTGEQVLKHGRHDQKTHGRRGSAELRDAADMWIGKTETSRFAMIDEIRGTARVLRGDNDFYPKSDAEGDASRVFNGTKSLLLEVADAPPSDTPLYRGLAVTRFDEERARRLLTEGYEFEELVASWTPDRQIADEFAGAKIGPRASVNTPAVSITLRADGLPSVEMMPNYSGDKSGIIGQADERVASGRYRVERVTQQSPRVFEVEVSFQGLPFDPEVVRNTEYTGGPAIIGGEPTIVRKSDEDDFARRMSLDIFDSVKPQAEVIKFAPGLTPVIKFNPRQPRAKDGRWTKGGAAWGGDFAGSPFEPSPAEIDYNTQMANIDYIMGRSAFPPDYSYEGLPPPTVTLRQLGREQVTKVRRKIKAWKEARERRYLENLSDEKRAKLIAANRARVDAKRAARGLPPVVYKAMDPVLPLLYDVFRDVVDDPFVWIALIQDQRPLSEIDGDLGAILDDMLDAVAPAETVIKFAPGLRPTLKHLGGKHDQKTHGRGGMSGPDSAPGGGRFSAWGDREGELRVAARVGPSREMLDNALYAQDIEVDPAEIRSRIADSYDYEIEMEVERRMSRTIGLETDEEVEWQREKYYEEELNTRVELYGESTAETIRAETLARDWETTEAIDSMNEVYGTYHTGVNSEGIEVTIQANVDSVIAPSFDGDVLQVEGTLMNEDGMNIGRFTRHFKQDGEGGVKVSHELLEIDDEEYQGAGFSKVFNRNAENYYISHGIDRIDVHAALDGGGYTWASSGFDFDTNVNNLAKSRNNLNFRMDQYEENFNVPRVVRNQMDDLRSRIQLDPSNVDFPTPKEFADIGRLPGAESWPGKVIMRGSNWYGTKVLRPEGARKSRTQEWNEAREAAAEANRERFVQLTLPGT